jgi:fructose-1,6-bisphosphatase
MRERETTLTEFIMEARRSVPEATGDFVVLLDHIRLACKRLSFLVGRGALGSSHGGSNMQREEPRRLDVLADEIFVRTNAYGGHLCGMLSQSMDKPYVIPKEYPRGKYLLVYDPLDGASSIDINVPVGSFFSVLQVADGVSVPGEADFLQPGVRQVCAGYAMYGPAAVLVLTLGHGVHGFTLDRDFGEYVLTHPDMQIPANTRELAINSTSARAWEPPVARYVEECMAGRGGPREKDFRVRFITTLVAEVHRLLVRGGLFMHPKDTRDPSRVARPRLLHEANPVAMLVEQAGGWASTGRRRVVEVAPQELHARVPLILGARDEVERIERYHREHDEGIDRPFSSPLFNERSLFAP